MTLRDDIASTLDRALALLNEAHDYFTYTKRAWGILHKYVHHEGGKFVLRNRSTNSTVNERDLVARARGYVERELLFATLQQFVSIFENFLSDVLRQWLLAYPKSLSARQLSGREIFDLSDKAAIVDALIAKELRDVFYDRPTNWFDYVKRLTGIQTPSDSDAEQFAEIKATRDVLVHGQGVANPYYVEKAGSAARAHAGQPLEVPEPYHQASWELICKLVRDIASELANKA